MKYHPHGCPVRYGLGLFGDRWSLIIIRDLMFFGRHSYSDLLTAGEGISTNILADRLAQLEASGIISKSRDPDHGKKYVYRLTEKGLDLMPVLFAIIDWAEKYDEQTAVPEDFITELRKRPKLLRRKILAGMKPL